MTREAVSPEDVQRAARVLEGRVRRTPVLPAGELSRRVGGRVSVKAENLQLTGSFKARGAFNALLRMPEGGSRARLVAASAGNHAQAVAFAARSAGAGAKLVMPAAAPVAKVAAVRQYGGEVLLVDGAIDEAAEVARGLAAEEGRALVHAFDDPVVVAGQGTVGLELAAQAPDTRLVVVPLGGGGLISGIAIAARQLIDGLRVVGVQSDACAPYPPSLEAHEPVPARGVNTICDGIAVKRPGEVTLPLVDRYVDQVVTVSDDEVAEAMVLLLERSKLVVEGAGAVGVAALLAGKVELPAVRATPARCCPAGTWTRRCWRNASAWGRPRPVGGWSWQRRCRTVLARWLGCWRWSRSTAATWWRWSTCVTASTSTCARRRSSS